MKLNLHYYTKLKEPKTTFSQYILSSLIQKRKDIIYSINNNLCDLSNDKDYNTYYVKLTRYNYTILQLQKKLQNLGFDINHQYTNSLYFNIKLLNPIKWSINFIISREVNHFNLIMVNPRLYRLGLKYNIRELQAFSELQNSSKVGEI